MVVYSYIGAYDWCFNMELDNADQISRKNSLNPKMFFSFLAAPDFYLVLIMHSNLEYYPELHYGYRLHQ